MNATQVSEARQACEDIWAFLRPKDQRECLEQYVTIRAFFMAAGEDVPEYADQVDE